MNLIYSQTMLWLFLLASMGSCGKANFSQSKSNKNKQYSENKGADAIGKPAEQPSDSGEQGNGQEARNDGGDSISDNGQDDSDCVEDGCSYQDGSDIPGGESDKGSDMPQNGDSDEGANGCDNENSCDDKDDPKNCDDGECDDDVEDGNHMPCEGMSCKSDEDSSNECDSEKCHEKPCDNNGACKDCTDECSNCSPEQDPPEIVVVEDGIKGGHFDVDTFYRDDMDKKGKKGKNGHDSFKLKEHVHEYDDKYSTNGVNFFGPSNGSDKADEVKIDDLISENIKFGIKLVNAKFNQGGFLYIGDTAYGYNNLPDPKKEYTKSDIGKLSIVFDLDSLSENGIQPATPKWVKDNDLGPEDSRRSGALTFQIIDLSSGEVLIECSVYWHKDGLKKFSFL
ncbi:MAG: hypothetical protein AB8G05_09700 [Oligoflexales bacterium]